MTKPENTSYQLKDFAAKADKVAREQRNRKLTIASIVLSLVILGLIAVNFAVQ